MTEHQHQATLIKWAAAKKAEWPELDLLYAIPNGGHRDVRVARKLSAEGVRRGVPDLHLPVARGGYHSLWIEMKTETGRVSPEQREWHRRLRAARQRVEVCRSWTAAADVIEAYLKLEVERG